MPKNNVYSKSDMVHVVDANGQVQPDQVPSAWVGTDLLPAGSKKATKAQVQKADGSDGGSDTSDSDADAGSDSGDSGQSSGS